MVTKLGPRILHNMFLAGSRIYSVSSYQSRSWLVQTNSMYSVTVAYADCTCTVCPVLALVVFVYCAGVLSASAVQSVTRPSTVTDVAMSIVCTLLSVIIVCKRCTHPSITRQQPENSGLFENAFGNFLWCWAKTRKYKRRGILLTLEELQQIILPVTYSRKFGK